MKIAIVGAPGSGKSELAVEIEKLLQSKCSSCKIAIIDDYIDDIGREVDLAMDGQTTYVGNLYAMLGRFTLERKAESEGAKHVITCGTMVDTGVYATRKAVEEQTQLAWIQNTNFMNIMGSLVRDTWRYDHVFVLSLDGSDPVSVEGAIDRGVFMALSTFKIPFVPLRGTLEEKVEKVRETIHGTPPLPEDQAQAPSTE